MPLIRPGMRKPPPGFDVVQAKLEEFEAEMKLATQEESKGVVGQTTRPRRADSSHHKRPREHDTQNASAEDDVARDTATDKGEASAPDASASPSPTAAAEGEDAPVPPLWRMAAINRARTRYVFHAYTKQRTISKEVYDYCVEMQLIDGGLARRWRLPGYERLCCTACGVPGAASLAANITSKYALRDKQERRLPSSSAASLHKSNDEKATCICRVPAVQRKNRHFVACAVCGCQGCCSADVASEKSASEEKDASS
ncbi:hypothetical protein ABB37_06889 [Leptomonas pyrrhocoris]|uniref:G10 protein n=1 Tax=Leptomonas pyrrhocoris TaxID=157538 RepID=A0A0M9FWN3_LEPPY|nr:hypothetical protein ABB37_06889 [Leptomonas pyrrhocoris]XP_015655942.1 hypothetical protein ABB37_06889 [Leptomonas pyrrhocoris]KPA77502.1 hypothetical protein ABB37_06889 [Leptomonas pyrrhocoris]KPA77503.1 hypothetical protein ABB37_06889 [Leptomonas pyrrhocoris]|eukprot:XP_015655941.1 hypothetical protein ABB37_06889 [Leptomonas pyrrhocoris]